MDEHVRRRAVERLESEPSQVARAGADTTQRHLGHALCREARDEAVAQVASAVDVDVAHRVIVGPRKDREEVEVSCPGLASRWILEPASLSQKVP